MTKHNWREIFNHNTSKLIQLLKRIEVLLGKKFPKILKYLKKDTNIDLAAVFSSIFITLFVYDVPHYVATRIFELFLFEGEEVLIRLMFKMIKIKQNKILKMPDLECLHYMRRGMIMECIKEIPLSDLLKN
jgi:hypothetical protein